ncbi:MAG TPA: hypothetical protein VHX66_14935 [Solirubrobacteraceae bacterium]|nr:hypothetical protein [Solirubrobacteraceae bacterium]
MPWTESSSPHFEARHEDSDERGTAAVLELLENTRESLSRIFPRVPDEVTVVMHAGPLALSLAAPPLTLAWIASRRVSRRYLAGWCSARTLHLLAPAALERRASAVPASRDMLMMTPAALYAQLAIAANNRSLPPPLRPRHARWAWLIWGAASHFSGQNVFARTAVARRLRDDPAPRFPPSLGDAALLGGTVFDLLERERGAAAAVELAFTRPEGSPARALERAFAGRSLIHSQGVWRAHLATLALP